MGAPARKNPSPLSIESRASTASSSIPAANKPVCFAPTHTLHIESQGIPMFRLPLPPGTLQTPILNSANALAYLSVRASRWKSNCVLQRRSTDEEEYMETVASTTYRFGCFRDPVVRFAGHAGDEDVLLKRKGVLTRSVVFRAKSQGKFVWRYGGKRERAAAAGERGEVKNLLMLEYLSPDAENSEKIRIAQLVRGDGTRSPGSSKSSAGNGGVLMMDLRGAGEEVDEVVVVATCLVMLKMEVDRRRELQAMMIGGGSGGGP